MRSYGKIGAVARNGHPEIDGRCRRNMKRIAVRAMRRAPIETDVGPEPMDVLPCEPIGARRVYHSTVRFPLRERAIGPMGRK